MKLIKKVNVTPVQSYTGQIIDSFNTEDDKQTNAPSLNAVENKLEWTEIASNTTASTNSTETISNLSSYNELLVALGTNDSTQYRVLNSINIPVSIFMSTTEDVSDGWHQLEYGESYLKGGISYVGDNQIKLYTESNSGIRVYAR